MTKLTKLTEEPPPEPKIELEVPPAPSQAAHTLRRVPLVFILGSLTAFGPLSIDMYLPALPALSRDFAASTSETQLTLSACVLGLATGQSIAGPLSDALGRKRPLLIGLATYALASLLCALAPSIGLLIACRFLQGISGAAGIVIARAIVRDLHSGVALARFFSILLLVTGLAPILAPIFGGLLLRFTSWRGVFVTLTLIGALLLLAAATGLRETLPPDRRQRGGIPTTLATFRQLLATRPFLGFALSSGLAFAGMFSYISGSPFVLQDLYGVSPQVFSLIFGSNALGFVIAGQINGRLVGRVPITRLLSLGLVTTATGGVTLLLVVSTGSIGLAGILPALFVMVASLGFVLPNATSLALSGQPRIAGSASALVGMLQFSIGAIAAPLVGSSGARTALPMAAVIATCGASALGVFLLLARSSEPQNN